MTSARCSHGSRWYVIAGLMLLALTWVPLHSAADCIGCFGLKGVVVRLKDGRTIAGHMPWNDSWRGKNTKPFPNVVVELQEFPGYVDVYTHLSRIKFPVETVVATRNPQHIAIADIRSVSAKPGPFEGTGGFGELPVVTPEAADLLQQAPKASCKYEDTLGGGQVYWLSYREDVLDDDLACLCKGPIGVLLHTGTEFNYIIKLYFPGD